MISFTALLFSATFRKKIERLARDILVDPIRVVQGDIGEVCSVIQLQRHETNLPIFEKNFNILKYSFISLLSSKDTTDTAIDL